MLRDCPAYQPTTNQLRFLLRWTATDLDDISVDRQSALQLLRAVLGRKLVVPEVYDAMKRVQEVMVKSHAAPVRQVRRQVAAATLGWKGVSSPKP